MLSTSDAPLCADQFAPNVNRNQRKSWGNYVNKNHGKSSENLSKYSLTGATLGPYN